MHLVLSPALPSELLAYIVSHCVYPTTLVVCASSDDFVRVCVEEGEDDDEDEDDDKDGEGGGAGDGKDDGRRGHRTNTHNPRWTSVSLLQVAVARHIRVAFVPTVAHLRAFLAAFDPAAGPVLPPPDPQDVSSFSTSAPLPPPASPPRLLVYGFVALHHDTSEWSAQGLAASAAVLVDAAWRAGWDAVLVEGRRGKRRRSRSRRRDPWDDAFPAQTLPVLSSGPRRQLQRAGYPPRTRPVRSVLARWFRFRAGPWEKNVEGSKSGEGETKESPAEPRQNERPSTRPAARAYVKDSEDEDEDEEDQNQDQHDSENDPT